MFKRILFSFLFLNIILISSTKSQSKAWVAPASAQQVKNPTPSLLGGKVIYTSYCTPCHGSGGKGDGPAAAALSPKPADHTSAAIKNETDGSLFWKISEGRKPMPQYKISFTPAQRWQLVNYIRSLSANSKKS